MSKAKSIISIILTLLVAACAEPHGQTPDAPDDSLQDPADVVQQSQAIVSGQELSQVGVEARGMVAVYHFFAESNAWFPRPCSGTVVRSANGVSKILTARHCVTQDAEIDGTVLSPDRVRVIQAARPGPAMPSLPANTIPAASIDAMPISAEFRSARDLAVITVNAPLQLGRYGFYFGDPGALAGKMMMAFGYGINQNLATCYKDPNVVTGAGIARMAPAPMQVTGGTRTAATTLVRYINIGPGSTPTTICGDSGGGDIIGLGPLNMPHLLGVHSIGEVDAADAAPNTFLQISLGGVFVSPESNQTLNLGLSGNVVAPFPISDPRSQKFVYDHSTGAFSAFPACMRVGTRSTDGTLGVIMGTCNSEASWTLTPSRQLRFQNNPGQCLTLLGNTTVLSPCADTGTIADAQRWFFHPQQ